MTDPTTSSELSVGASEQRARAAYIADLTAELAELARGSGFQTLAYLLDMARIEANELSGPDR